MGPSHPPRVRVVVLNWNSAWFTRRCLVALEATEYPPEFLEIVLVDNASVDGSLEQLQFAFPNIRVIANESNLGFAEGCNRGMRDLAQVDAVALVNNDAVPEPGWLWPLVVGLQSDPQVGAVAAGLVLDPPFTQVALSVTQGHAQIESVCVGPLEVLDRTQSAGVRTVGHPDWPMDLDYFVGGTDAAGPDAAGTASLLVPAAAGERVISLRVSGRGSLTATTSVDQVLVELSESPIQLQLRAGDDRIELLNGLGTGREENSEGFDLRFGQPAQLLASLSSETVPGFCGGGVLLRTAMLNQVGLFDPRLFAYYEDSDLAWRASRAGWHTITAPESIIRHSFGASAAATSPGFFVHGYRNWLMVVLRNAGSDERKLALRSIWDRLKWAVRANVFSRLKHGHLPRTKLILAWKRVVWNLLIELPYLHKTRHETVGVLRTEKIRSPLRPSPGARPPSSRPGGPLVVYLDITQNPAAAKVLLTQFAVVEPCIDLVPVVAYNQSAVGYRRTSAAELQKILGLYGQALPSSPVDIDVLSLGEFAVGSAILDCHDDLILAKPATANLLQIQPRTTTQGHSVPSKNLPELRNPANLSRVHLEEFAAELLLRFGLP